MSTLMYTKTYQFKLSVKDDKYDACKTANIKISGREILPLRAGFNVLRRQYTHERLLS